MGLVRGLSIHHQRDPVVTWFQPNNDDENRPTMAELADFIVKKKMMTTTGRKNIHLLRGSKKKLTCGLWHFPAAPAKATSTLVIRFDI